MLLMALVFLSLAVFLQVVNYCLANASVDLTNLSQILVMTSAFLAGLNFLIRGGYVV